MARELSLASTGRRLEARHPSLLGTHHRGFLGFPGLRGHLPGLADHLADHQVRDQSVGPQRLQPDKTTFNFNFNFNKESLHPLQTTLNKRDNSIKIFSAKTTFSKTPTSKLRRTNHQRPKRLEGSRGFPGFKGGFFHREQHFTRDCSPAYNPQTQTDSTPTLLCCQTRQRE
ncbi:hypothetical protein BCR33DRAFT_466957 [Rhizoclosmatium globosum]|uniref:Uncharacterized protein n=1 Tax=Rhizoclosmatium globosum TaxID=329046 RepID=A0A1Y2BT06_9FUNG|nr:hypothetical protein BCR33DRAFT_466957 [Rhizoclosmatium globosum]|eukprot:ORY37255.1 hypothetical protein BCR33DRAFT_466957 [Rhizoclosmatium globosum]